MHHIFNIHPYEKQCKPLQMMYWFSSFLFYFRPTLADQVRIGYFSMDRACQTEESEIIDLKETTNLMSNLVQVCQSYFHYFYHTLNAEAAQKYCISQEEAILTPLYLHLQYLVQNKNKRSNKDKLHITSILLLISNAL